MGEFDRKTAMTVDQLLHALDDVGKATRNWDKHVRVQLPAEIEHRMVIGVHVVNGEVVMDVI